MAKKVSIIILLLMSQAGVAAHLVGGDLAYTCLGNNLYEIRLTVYRDCASLGAQFDNPAPITVYDGNQNLVKNFDVFFSNRSTLPLTAPNNCTTLPSFVCTEKAIYTDTVTLPPNSSGYVITYQRCCRNNSISNIPTPGDQGSTYTVDIPANDSPCNNSPAFNSPPPVALCLNVPVSLDLSATENDGDQLVYSLCSPFTGGGQANNSSFNGIIPDPAAPPPYQQVPFLPGYSATNPLPGSPAFSIDPNTGVLTGRPTAIGQYVFAICVQEYRNGQLISTVRRDFQFNVTGACQGTAAVISGQQIDSSTLCTGETVTFNESCVNTNNYFWNFGDPATNADTSVQQNPTYTYSDTGVYEVMLIANPQSNCADTTYSTFRVYDPVSVNFDFDPEPCFDQNSFDFEVSGRFSDSATFHWDFAGATSHGTTSTSKKPAQVVFNEPGFYPVTLTVTDFECTDSYTDTIKLYERPQLHHTVRSRSNCPPLAADFTDSSIYMGEAYHSWDFGDGNTSTERNPVHIYEETGNYTVTHRVIVQEGCRDTLEESFTEIIEVWPQPQATLNISPQRTDIYNPEFFLKDSAAGNYFSTTILPGGEIVEDLEAQYFSASDTGRLSFTHIAFNEYGCADTLIQEVYVEEPFNLFVPNAFTPNGDGVNDQFSYVVTGVKEHVLEIYTRWGERVFKSTDASDKWDGTSQATGERLPGGVYSYVLIAQKVSEGKDKTKLGTIHIIR